LLLVFGSDDSAGSAAVAQGGDGAASGADAVFAANTVAAAEAIAEVVADAVVVAVHSPVAAEVVYPHVVVHVPPVSCPYPDRAVFDGRRAGEAHLAARDAVVEVVRAVVVVPAAPVVYVDFQYLVGIHSPPAW
jgi:hypothetical protein